MSVIAQQQFTGVKQSEQSVAVIEIVGANSESHAALCYISGSRVLITDAKLLPLQSLDFLSTDRPLAVVSQPQTGAIAVACSQSVSIFEREEEDTRSVWTCVTQLQITGVNSLTFLLRGLVLAVTSASQTTLALYSPASTPSFSVGDEADPSGDWQATWKTVIPGGPVSLGSSGVHFTSLSSAGELIVWSGGRNICLKCHARHPAPSPAFAPFKLRHPGVVLQAELQSSHWLLPAERGRVRLLSSCADSVVRVWELRERVPPSQRTFPTSADASGAIHCECIITCPVTVACDLVVSLSPISDIPSSALAASVSDHFCCHWVRNKRVLVQRMIEEWNGRSPVGEEEQWPWRWAAELEKAWSNAPDLIGCVHPLDGSLLVWSLDTLQNRDAISFTSCLPESFVPSAYHPIMFPLDSSSSGVLYWHPSGALQLHQLKLSISARQASPDRLTLIGEVAGHHSCVRSVTSLSSQLLASLSDSEMILWRTMPASRVCVSTPLRLLHKAELTSAPLAICLVQSVPGACAFSWRSILAVLFSGTLRVYALASHELASCGRCGGGVTSLAVATAVSLEVMPATFHCLLSLEDGPPTALRRLIVVVTTSHIITYQLNDKSQLVKLSDHHWVCLSAHVTTASHTGWPAICAQLVDGHLTFWHCGALSDEVADVSLQWREWTFVRGSASELDVVSPVEHVAFAHPTKFAVLLRSTGNPKVTVQIYECESTGCNRWTREAELVVAAPATGSRLDWLPLHNGQHVLAVTTVRSPEEGGIVHMFSPLLAAVSQQAPTASSLKMGLLQQQRVLTSDDKTPAFSWLQIAQVPLGISPSVTVLPPNGTIVTATHNQMAAYSLWQAEAAGDPDTLSRSLSDALLLSARSMSMARSRASMMNIHSVSARPAPGTGQHAPKLAQVLAEVGVCQAAVALNPVLPQYHPRVLLQLVNFSLITPVHNILLHLLRCMLGEDLTSLLSQPEDCDLPDILLDVIPPLPVNKILAETREALASTTAEDYNVLFDTTLDDEIGPGASCAFSDAHIKLLTRCLQTFHLPGLSPLDQMYLLALADTVAHLPTDSRLDQCAVRFLLAVHQHTYLAQALRVIRPLSSDALAWAFFSQNQLELFTGLNVMAKSEVTWPELRQYGICYWLNNSTTMKGAIEKVARSHYQLKKDPLDSALFYLALGKKNVLAGLFKLAGNQRMEAFFRNDFAQDRWQNAALKNAFDLMSKQRFEQAAAFFLLAGALKDAVEVCLVKLKDTQLALILCHLNDTALRDSILQKNVIDADSDPFHVVIAKWMLGDYHSALETLLSYTDVSELSRLSSVFSLASWLEQHPLVRRQAVTDSRSAISLRTLHFHTAHAFTRAGCPMLAVHVLRQLPVHVQREVLPSRSTSEVTSLATPLPPAPTITIAVESADWGAPTLFDAFDAPPSFSVEEPDFTISDEDEEEGEDDLDVMMAPASAPAVTPHLEETSAAAVMSAVRQVDGAVDVTRNDMLLSTLLRLATEDLPPLAPLLADKPATILRRDIQQWVQDQVTLQTHLGLQSAQEKFEMELISYTKQNNYTGLSLELALLQTPCEPTDLLPLLDVAVSALLTVLPDISLNTEPPALALSALLHHALTPLQGYTWDKLERVPVILVSCWIAVHAALLSAAVSARDAPLLSAISKARLDAASWSEFFGGLPMQPTPRHWCAEFSQPDKSVAARFLAAVVRTRGDEEEEEENLERSDLAWRIITPAVYQLANNAYWAALRLIQLESPQDLQPSLAGTLSRLEVDMYRRTRALPSSAPDSFLPYPATDVATLAESFNRPLSGVAGELWAELLAKPLLTPLFLRHCLTLPHHSSDISSQVVDDALLITVAAEKRAQPDSVVRLVHRDHEPLWAFAFNPAQESQMALASGKELLQLDISNIQEPPSWAGSSVDYSLEQILHTDLSDGCSSYLVLQEPIENQGILPHMIAKNSTSNTKFLSAHPTQPFLLSGGGEHVTCWQWRHMMPHHVLELDPKPRGRVTQLSWAPNGNKFLVAESDGFIRVSSLASQTVAGGSKLAPVWQSQPLTKRCYAATFLGTSSQIAVAGHTQDGSGVCLLDTLLPPSRSIVAKMDTHDSAATAVVHLPRYQALLAGTKKGDIVVLDIRQNAPLLTLSHAHSTQLTRLAADPLQHYFASGSADGDVKLWSIHGGDPLLQLPALHKPRGLAAALHSVTGSIGVIALSLDSRLRLYSAGSESTLAVHSLVNILELE